MTTLADIHHELIWAYPLADPYPEHPITSVDYALGDVSLELEWDGESTYRTVYQYFGGGNQDPQVHSFSAKEVLEFSHRVLGREHRRLKYEFTLRSIKDRAFSFALSLGVEKTSQGKDILRIPSSVARSFAQNHLGKVRSRYIHILRERVVRKDRLLQEALDTIVGLADQQAMEDNWYLEAVEKIRKELRSSGV